MSLNKIVEVATVANLVKKGLVNREGIRILHCSFAVTPKPDWKQFEKEKYGKFEQLIREPSPSRNLYLTGHIPQALHVDLDVAMYPSQYQRYTYYPPHIFEQYVQLLGINKDDHLIFCGRDRLSGMLFSSKMAWLFKSYGHEKLSLLNGGLAAWEAEGYKLETESVEIEQRGNWTAKDCLEKYNIRFEELDQMDGDKKVIEQTDKINFLDTRHPDQFEGKQETGLDQCRVNGTHIPGFKNTPVAEIFAKDGKLRSKEELREWLISHGYEPSKPTVTSCMMGIQASLLAYVIDDAFPDAKPRMYNGSLKEMELRDPKRISGGLRDIPPRAA